MLRLCQCLLVCGLFMMPTLLFAQASVKAKAVPAKAPIRITMPIKPWVDIAPLASSGKRAPRVTFDDNATKIRGFGYDNNARKSLAGPVSKSSSYGSRPTSVDQFRWEIVGSNGRKGQVKTFATVTGTLIRAQAAVDSHQATYGSQGWSFGYRLLNR